ncbi:TPR-like protein [Amniculicola lignicola CBS 123094]|uniref:TPR-like protein n=1 Tax=Amniculicola lignicola CBS 123094 TaxID=1392246 RepID=A0A6A5WBD1_9PLEO|nr:TPR-like protein [Amniculicola lignicola CBS 123094]
MDPIAVEVEGVGHVGYHVPTLVLGRGAIAQLTYTGDDADAPEIKKLIDAVAGNEDDFDNWTALITKVSELEGGVTRNSSPAAIDIFRAANDLFLTKFPRLYVYWAKYANVEFSIGGTETAEMVWERAVSAVPANPELWAQYCQFKETTCHNVPVTRELYERGAAIVGLDFWSDKFWDPYLDFEKRFGNASTVTRLQARISALWLYAYRRYYDAFVQTAIHSRDLDELLSPVELAENQRIVMSKYEALPEPTDIELDREMRAQISRYYAELGHKCHLEVTKRWSFEEKIKRQWFEVSEVPEEELVNWRKYLQFEEIEGDFKRIVYLYERCLTICASYDEFWLRYARWMTAMGKEEDVRNIYRTACTIYVPIGRPTVRLNWARFEESVGNLDTARDIHLSILEALPTNIETMVSLAGQLRRDQGIAAAVSWLERCKSTVSHGDAGRLIAEQARIHWQGAGDVEAARQVFKKNRLSFCNSAAFAINYLRFEMKQPRNNEAHDHIREVHDLLREMGALPVHLLKYLSHEYMEYLLDCGGKDAMKEYIELDKQVNGPYSVQTGLKRKVAEDGDVQTTDRRLVASNGHPGVEVNEAEFRRGVDPYARYYTEQGQDPANQGLI